MLQLMQSAKILIHCHHSELPRRETRRFQVSSWVDQRGFLKAALQSRPELTQRVSCERVGYLGEGKINK